MYCLQAVSPLPTLTNLVGDCPAKGAAQQYNKVSEDPKSPGGVATARKTGWDAASSLIQGRPREGEHIQARWKRGQAVLAPQSQRRL